MMDSYFYWEKASADIWNIPVEELFSQSQKGSAPYARYFCMLYMVEHKGFAKVDAARRYKLSGAMVFIAERKLQEWIDVDKSVYAKYKVFQAYCDRHSKGKLSCPNELATEAVGVMLSKLQDNYSSVVMAARNYLNGKKSESEMVTDVMLMEKTLDNIKNFFLPK